jgi:hypothetical protein
VPVASSEHDYSTGGRGLTALTTCGPGGLVERRISFEVFVVAVITHDGALISSKAWKGRFEFFFSFFFCPAFIENLVA